MKYKKIKQERSRMLGLICSSIRGPGLNCFQIDSYVKSTICRYWISKVKYA